MRLRRRSIETALNVLRYRKRSDSSRLASQCSFYSTDLRRGNVELTAAPVRCLSVLQALAGVLLPLAGLRTPARVPCKSLPRDANGWLLTLRSHPAQEAEVHRRQAARHQRAG